MTPYGPPTSPPPAFIPPKPRVSYIVDCMHNYTYVWPEVGEPFWFYPTWVEQTAVAGYIWTGRMWTFYGFDPRLVEAVSCPPIPTPY